MPQRTTANFDCIDSGSIKFRCRKASHYPKQTRSRTAGSRSPSDTLVLVKPTKDDLKRYAENFLREQDGIALYRALAHAEKDPARSEIFEKLAKAEERHATRWAKLLQNNGAPIPLYSPGWRVRTLGLL